MARRRKSRGLGSPSAKHAKMAETLVAGAERHAKLSRQGSCTIRFTSLTAAIDSIGRARAHAFGSGGRVMKGAITPKTTSSETARRIYDAGEDVQRATSEFRSECVKHGGTAGLGRARRRRR